jgi:Ca2+/H+ antiporter
LRRCREWPAWSIAANPALTDGSYTATATQADDATNSTTTSTISFRVDTVGPAVTITALIAADGESNWLEGAQLVAVYLIIATAFWYL